MNTIQYAIDPETGYVWSRLKNEIAFPVLAYPSMSIILEKENVLSMAYYWNNLEWTKKIPKEIKNQHRLFWGLKAI